MADMKNIFESRQSLIIAHRGASKSHRDNTLEAFEAAVRAGADVIEIDVRRTGDGVLVVHHDPNISGSQRTISELTFTEAERQARESGFHLPTLEETLGQFGNRIAFDIELKETGYEGDVVTFLQERASEDSIVITAFADETIRKVKSLWPEVMTGLILGIDPPASLMKRYTEFFPGNRLRRCGADLVVPHYRLLRFGFLRRMKRLGHPVWVWTVDDPDRANRLRDGGVSGIITNDPDAMACVR